MIHQTPPQPSQTPITQLETTPSAPAETPPDALKQGEHAQGEHAQGEHAQGEHAQKVPSLRDVARYTPHVARLVGRCLRDRRVPIWRKSSLAGLALYLAMPFDIVPDFIPILGQADDLLLVVWVLRGFVRAVPPAVLDEHWDGDIPLPQLMDNAQIVLRSLFKRRRDQAPHDEKSDELKLDEPRSDE